MANITIQLPVFDAEHKIEIQVKINGKNKRLHYCVEIFDWDEMCETELPVPSIDKQREIVKEYNTIVNRITLNEKLNQKLEETAQAIYKHWFVDFEFPDKDGKPYKSR